MILSYLKTKRSLVKAEAIYINRIKSCVADYTEMSLNYIFEAERLKQQIERKDMIIEELESQITQLTGILANRESIEYYGNDKEEV